mmetsp:Transcript_31796/g.46349  ORF Transcript_31796/g.46349 Transcript_31796/m.46349 type:complete len:267 (-) Transcript_31796:83-883(-)
MTYDEKSYVSDLMTSGDVNQLAQAAQILMGVADLYASNASSTTTTTYNNSALSSSEREAMVIRALAMANINENNDTTSTPTPKKSRKTKQKLKALHERYPLPTRMPKSITLSSASLGDPYSYQCLLKFKDEEWSGKISDAFSWVYSNRMDNDDDNDISSRRRKTKNRVLIKSVKRGWTHYNNLSVEKGDIVTHFNGEEFHGTAEDLRCLIKQYIQKKEEEEEEMGVQEGSKNVNVEFTMVFNAEEGTAIALRERAICFKEALKERR